VAINITQGNSAQFTIEFLSSSKTLTVPVGGQLVINYTNVSTLASTSQTITLSQIGNFFTGTWNSAVAATGLAPWSVFAAGSTAIAAQSDTIRVIDP
jgi:hypothetical protein